MNLGQLEGAALDMYEALKAYQALDDFHAKCEDCEPEYAPEACETCFPFTSDARLKMRAAISKAELSECSDCEKELLNCECQF